MATQPNDYSEWDNWSAGELRAEAERLGVLPRVGATRPELLVALREYRDGGQADRDNAEQATPPTDLNSMTLAQLREEAPVWGVDTAGLRTKAEIIDAIQAAQGITEDQQAAMGGGEYSENPNASAPEQPS